VIDLERGAGYLTSPYWHGDQSGSTFLSADGRHVLDAGRFILEAKSGQPLFDMRVFEEVRALDDDEGTDGDLDDSLFDFAVLSFVRRSDGGWRFVVPGRVLDERGATIVELPREGAAALDPQGTRVLCATREEVRIVDLATRVTTRVFDLSPLRAALAAPATPRSELWDPLLALWGTAEAVAHESAASLRASLGDDYRPGDVSDRELEEVMRAARDAPHVPPRLAIKSG
jgi:hypothetical protein